MLQKLKKTLIMNGSWKTTLVGCILAVFIAVAPLISTGSLDWKAIVAAVLIAIGSYLQKDNNVTGGNKSNGLTPS
jgi:hypothetical protein